MSPKEKVGPPSPSALSNRSFQPDHRVLGVSPEPPSLFSLCPRLGVWRAPGEVKAGSLPSFSEIKPGPRAEQWPDHLRGVNCIMEWNSKGF